MIGIRLRDLRNEPIFHNWRKKVKDFLPWSLSSDLFLGLFTTYYS